MTRPVGRPRKPPNEKRDQLVTVRLTPEELATLDAVRDDVSRSEWFRQQLARVGR